jgi:hypothetical protein
MQLGMRFGKARSSSNPLGGIDWTARIIARWPRGTTNVTERKSPRYYVLTTRLGGTGALSVRIHTAECGYCNNGRGRLHGGVQARGQWEGPYDYGEAIQVAARKALPDIRLCQRCMPTSSQRAATE